MRGIEDGIEGGAGDALEQGLENAQSLGDVLFGCGVVDEGSEREFLSGRGCVERLSEACLKDCYNSGDGVAVFWIGLGAIAKLLKEKLGEGQV